MDGGTHKDGDYYIHRGIVTEGTVVRGALCEARVDEKKRSATQRNHTATHLLHYYLRKVLGTHVEQAGSLVEPSRLRFDFLHHAPMKPAEIARIQDEVNTRIRSNLEVATKVMDLDEARKEGAMALFGEKYADQVRVVTIHDGAVEGNEQGALWRNPRAAHRRNRRIQDFIRGIDCSGCTADRGGHRRGARGPDRPEAENIEGSGATGQDRR